MPDAIEGLVVTNLGKRSDFLPVIAGWLWTEWWQRRGHSLDQTQAMYSTCCAHVGPPQTFVLLLNDTPIGTATLARTDLDERPQLTPWLAGVFVVPGMRGRGYVRHLLATFDDACRVASIPTAWLYTSAAERVYLRAGWQAVEMIQREGKPPVTLMRREFCGQAPVST